MADGPWCVLSARAAHHFTCMACSTCAIDTADRSMPDNNLFHLDSSESLEIEPDAAQRACPYIYMYIYIYIYSAYVHAYTNVHIYLYTYIYIYVCVCECVHMTEGMEPPSNT